MEQLPLPHKLTLTERTHLTMTGVTEVVSFDDSAVVLKTSLGTLVVQGDRLQLKTLSPEGGQVAVEGNIHSMNYEQTREPGSTWRKLFR